MIDLPETKKIVNDIKADIHDKNTVYAVFDNHKFGDFNPYIYMSKNKGSTWKKISSNLPENTLLWRVVQDHINSNLLFLGTEFGLYFSNNKGKEWIKLDGGMPNISVRDIAIQKKEKMILYLQLLEEGIYILDDYATLRTFNNKEEKSKLFSVRDGYCYNQKNIRSKKASQGDNYFVAENPPFGVEFTYYLNEKILSKKEIREKKEKKTEAEQV